MQQNEYYVITGGPGVGKTSLIAELERRNYTIIPEDARRIIQEQAAAAGNGLPWRDTSLYAKLMQQEALKSYQQAQQIKSPQAGFIFFDRGLIDTICYRIMEGMTVSRELQKQADTFRYASPVFILPPWKEIYTTDKERKQTWAVAVRTYEEMRQTYIHYGYTVTDVPKDTVSNRADFILSQISNG